MEQIFVSYSRKDLGFVKRLVESLESYDLRVWWDLSRIKGGDKWTRTIQRALAESKYFVVVLSSNSIESEWVEREYLYAMDLGIKIIPILLETLEIPMSLSNIQYLDFRRGRYSNNLYKLKEIFHGNGDEIADSESKNSSIPYWIIGIVVIIVIGVTLLIIYSPKIVEELSSTRNNGSEFQLTEPSISIENVTPTYTSIPVPTLEPIQAGTVLLQEDFEDKEAQRFRPWPDSAWAIIQDQGNWIYDVNSLVETVSPKAQFGSAHWSDYSIEFRLKLIENNGPQAKAGVRFREYGEDGPGYQLELNFLTNELIVTYFDKRFGSEWIDLREVEMSSLDEGKWYRIRVEAQDTYIRVYIDEDEILNLSDSRVETGWLSLVVWEGVRVQYDDIEVTALGY